jgi:hypothetical protein
MARKSDRVAAAARRYQQALEAQTAALQRGDEAAIEKAAEDAEAARGRLDALTSTMRPLVGAAGGAAGGAALGALGGPGLAAAGGAAGAFIGGVLASPRAAKADSRASARRPFLKQQKPNRELMQLKKKLLE